MKTPAVLLSSAFASIKLLSLATLAALAMGRGASDVFAESPATLLGTMTWNEMPMVRAAAHSPAVSYVMKYHMRAPISMADMEKIQGWLADPTFNTNATSRTGLAVEIKKIIKAPADTYGIKAIEVLAEDVATGGAMTEWLIAVYEDVNTSELPNKVEPVRYLEISREAVIATKEDFQLVVSYVRDHNQTKGRDILANVFANDAVVAELLQR